MKRIRRRRRRIRRADSEQRGDGDDGGALGNGGRTNRVTTKGTPKENGKCDKTAYFTVSNPVLLEYKYYQIIAIFSQKRQTLLISRKILARFAACLQLISKILHSLKHLF